MYYEDEILLGQKAKDETQDFINEHFENPEQGWPTFRFKTNSSFEEYKDRKLNENKARLDLFYV